MIASFNVWRREDGLSCTRPADGLEPEHADSLR
jgi:hypothetical protein